MTHLVGEQGPEQFITIKPGQVFSYEETKRIVERMYDEEDE